MFSRDTSHKNYRFNGTGDLHEIIKEIAYNTGLNVKDVGFISYMLLEGIVNRTVENGSCRLLGFGDFLLKDYNFTDFNNDLRSVKVIKFVPGYKLKGYIKGVGGDQSSH